MLVCAMELFEGLRRRRKNGFNLENKGNEGKQSADKNPTRSGAREIETGTYWLTRIVFLRSLGLIYCKYCCGVYVFQ